MERLQQRLNQESEHHQRQQQMQNERIQELEAALDQTERSLQDERRSISELKHSHEAAWKGLPHELAQELADLRTQNSKLKALHEDKTVNNIDGEE
jgi:chromosome segregation ATPase